MHISERAIRRPVTVMMGVLIVIILGIMSLSRIPIDLYPKIEIPTIAVITSYSGVGPEEMENLVTKPVEQAVASVAGIKSVTSTSREGSSMVIVEFSYGTDLDKAVTEVTQKVERAKRSLPDDVDSPTVARMDPNSTAVLTLAVSADMGADQLKSFVQDQMAPSLERINGVASVSVSGGLDREIKIVVDQSKLEQYGISLSDISQQLKSQNLDSSGGNITEGGVSYTVRSLGKFKSVDDIRKVSIPMKDGSRIFLEDLALIQDGFKEVSIENTMNNQTTVTMSIMKQSGTNTVAVVDDLYAELDRQRASMPQSMSVMALSDQSSFIRASIDTLVHDTLIGGVLAILIILLFLKSASNTVIIATAIPISVISTFTLMFFADMSINIMSLGGLTLGIGMIVDDAIVVLENIHRHRETGLSIKESAVKGTKEVAMPVIAATLTTVAVFFPIVFVEGVTAQLFRDLGVTVSFSLLASLIVSLTVTPMLTSKWTMSHKKAALKAAEHAEKRKDSRGLAFYRRILNWSLHHRKSVLAIGLASLVAGVGLIPFIGSEFMPTSDQGQINVSISMPNGTELEKTKEAVTQAEAILATIPEVKTIFTALGSTNATRGNSASTSAGSFLLILSDKSERQRTTAEVTDEIRQKLNRFPGARLRVSEAGGATLPGMGGGGGQFGGSAPISYAIRGNDEDTLKEVAESLTAAIGEVQGVREADNNLEESRPEIQVKLDRVRAADLGVTQSLISSTIQTALKDQVATKYETAGTEVDVTLSLSDGQVSSMQEIGNLLLTTPKGELIQIKDVADVVMANGPQAIQRYNQTRVVNVTASTAPGQDLGTVTTAIDQVLATYPIPPGYTIEKQGQNQQMDESTKSMLIAFGLAIVLVYIILAAQFESMVYPLSIMLSVPLSIFGATFSLWVTGRPVSVPAFIGLILLAGLVVRNAIVLIDFTNILRREGMDRTEALLTAGPVRLRPILMTTFCTVLALLPLALGLGEGAESQAPMATVVIGGLLFSTMLTLVVIPVVYAMLDDITIRLKKVVRITLPFRKPKTVGIEK
ncbi:efflux RND transporter permease subunit [Brevibacillus choshinensis]|uniref:efflux RND transporter permease subunit n=1 Tax=Brevibacillus choshinensis TaxID=54911 RepID=UPI002E23545E|nr:efflux RND transporter permease subunit [Brevibacillus choshinensis]